MLAVVRVEADELERIKGDVIADGRAYDGEDMTGAQLDAGYGLAAEGFTVPTITETTDPKLMVLYVSRPHDHPTSTADVVERLQRGWMQVGSFKHEAHAISVDAEVVALDFVTWWDGGAFYTGRIEVVLSREA